MARRVETSKTGARGRASRTERGARVAVLHLDAEIYTAAALERARQAFSHLAEIELSSRGGRWVVRMAAKAAVAPDRLADEFANHALSCLLVNP